MQRKIKFLYLIKSFKYLSATEKLLHFSSFLMEAMSATLSSNKVTDIIQKVSLMSFSGFGRHPITSEMFKYVFSRDCDAPVVSSCCN